MKMVQGECIYKTLVESSRAVCSCPAMRSNMNNLRPNLHALKNHNRSQWSEICKDQSNIYLISIDTSSAEHLKQPEFIFSSSGGHKSSTSRGICHGVLPNADSFVLYSFLVHCEHRNVCNLGHQRVTSLLSRLHIWFVLCSQFIDAVRAVHHQNDPRHGVNGDDGDGSPAVDSRSPPPLRCVESERGCRRPTVCLESPATQRMPPACQGGRRRCRR